MKCANCKNFKPKRPEGRWETFNEYYKPHDFKCIYWNVIGYSVFFITMSFVDNIIFWRLAAIIQLMSPIIIYYIWRKRIPKNKVESENKYVYYYDDSIKRRVPHVVKDNVAISLVTGRKRRVRR